MAHRKSDEVRAEYRDRIREGDRRLVDCQQEIHELKQLLRVARGYCPPHLKKDIDAYLFPPLKDK